MFEMYKVFDCQQMSKEVKSALRDIIQDLEYSHIYNGMYFDWTHLPELDPDIHTAVYIKNYNIIRDYLFRNGATSLTDKILIIYWW